MLTLVWHSAAAALSQVAKQHGLRKLILAGGTGLFSTSDTELMAQMLARPCPVDDAEVVYRLAQAARPPASAASASLLTSAPRPATPSRGFDATAGTSTSTSSSGSSPSAAPALTAGHASGPSLLVSSPLRGHGPGVASAAGFGGSGLAVTVPAAGASSAGMGAASAPASSAFTPTATPVPPPSFARTPSGRGPPAWCHWVARIARLMYHCEGAYSIVALTREGVFGFRDPVGLRPLCLGYKVESDGSTTYLLASESCAFGTVGAELLREVQPGEIVRIGHDGSLTCFVSPTSADALDLVDVTSGTASPTASAAASHHAGTTSRGTTAVVVASATGCAGCDVAISLPLLPVRRTPAFCVFEYVYFARPDSVLEGQMVHTVRTRLGAALFREAPAPTADIVSGVPDSSIAAAIGFAAASGLPFTEVFCKNRYIGRTFIKPDDALRKHAIQLKYNALSHVLKGKSVVLVDDSLVRGNTLQQLVPLLRHGGAREVHIRISSPPIRHPCYFGVDIGSYEELIAHHKETTEDIRAHIGADSLAYLTFDGMMAAVGAGIVDDAPAAAGSSGGGCGSGGGSGKRHCAACFTGGAWPRHCTRASGSPHVAVFASRAADYPLEYDSAPSGCC